MPLFPRAIKGPQTEPPIPPDSFSDFPLRGNCSSAPGSQFPAYSTLAANNTVSSALQTFLYYQQYCATQKSLKFPSEENRPCSIVIRPNLARNTRSAYPKCLH